MAPRLSRIRQGLWYDAECKFCGRPIDCLDVESYRAIPSRQGRLSLEHSIPVLEHSDARRIIIGPVTASRIRVLGSLPEVYLTHLLCIKIFRKATGCSTPPISLLTIVCILAPTSPVDTAYSHPLSDLDGDALAAIFSPTSRHSQLQRPSPGRSLRDPLYNLPPEMLSQVLSHCQPDHALAITVGLADTFWRQVVKGDVARHHLTVAIQATQLLQKQTHDEYYREDVIELSGKMVARFVSLGSEVYLRDIVKRGECVQLSEGDVEFCLDKPPKLLAIQADHLGVCNVAFSHAPDGTPEFLRDRTLPPNMFVDRVDDESFAFLRIVSDVSCCFFLCETPSANFNSRSRYE
jgi:hypothetical protein